jgi:hypothetical protein
LVFESAYKKVWEKEVLTGKLRPMAIKSELANQIKVTTTQYDKYNNDECNYLDEPQVRKVMDGFS